MIRMEIREISYEKARLDYFQKQEEKARRKYEYHLKRLKINDSPTSENRIRVDEAAEVLCYYRDVVRLLVVSSIAERKNK